MDHAPMSPVTAAKRPKGILKNPNSGPLHPTSPTSAFHAQGANSTNNAAAADLSPTIDPISLDRPDLSREMSEKEITLANTIANAGPRRASSAARSSISASRRQSTHSLGGVDGDENSPRLKWDEANLWHAEQARDSTMKIDEPKTPYAPRYDPAEDEMELEAINAQGLAVDELDMRRGSGSSVGGHGHGSGGGIPDLDIGEPEDGVPPSAIAGDGERRVIVDDDGMMEDGLGGHGEDNEHSMSAESRRKHQEFEERRKRHYEMKNVKGMLGNPEDMDDDAER